MLMRMEAKDIYKLSVDDIFKKFNASTEGLSDEEALQRQKIYGKNKLEVKQKNKLLNDFLNQFKDLLILILIISGLISIFLESYRDAVVLFTIVIINAIIGFIQEYKAEKILDSLKSLVKAKAHLQRSGKLTEISAEEIVPGDIIILEAGDRVPADIRLIEENDLGANDFSLTGESNPVRKFIHEIAETVLLGDRNNMVFMGTTIATGNGKGVAVAIGMQTEIGRIANLSHKTEDELSPLQKELNHVARKMAIIAGCIGGLLFFGGLFREFGLKEAFVFAIAVAASCVPQGMPTQVSVALSLSAGRLAKQKAIIKKLSGVETLGSTHIICTDKTGTLTKNEMTVQHCIIGKNHFSISGVGYEPKGSIFDLSGKEISAAHLKQLKLFFETGILASNAEILPPDPEHPVWHAIGDPTEAALITLAEKVGLSKKVLNQEYQELKEFPFDACRKMMSSIRQINAQTIRAYIKGAPLITLDKCARYFDGQEVKPLTKDQKQYFSQQDEEYAKKAYRVLAYAYRDLSNFNQDLKIQDVERDLTFLGLVAMMDPPRDEVKAAIEAAKQAFIRIIIITGDYALTASAIAQKIGIGAEISVITTNDLAKMSDISLLHSLIHKNIIFSRTSPEDKLRIVDLLKRAGEIIAVTGDGVNDAPALKRADIGVAMGKTGTDVAKESSEIVLIDDSFATLVSAIKEGRIIYTNLKKTITSSITSNGGELFTVLLSLLFGYLYDIPMAILAIQILAVDLGGEMLPLTFLTWDPGEKDIMKEAPRNPTDYILNNRRLFDIAWTGFLMGLFAYLNFILLSVREDFSWVGFSDLDSLVYARGLTLSYVTIVFIQWMNILSRRTKTKVLSSYLWSSPRLLLGYLFSIILLLNISYNPYISQFLQTGPLKLSDWLMAILAAIIFLIIRETYKKLSFSYKKGLI